MSDVREILKKRPLLFDGGMGTYYKAKPGQECEQANLLDPEGVLAVRIWKQVPMPSRPIPLVCRGWRRREIRCGRP